MLTCSVSWMWAGTTSLLEQRQRTLFLPAEQYWASALTPVLQVPYPSVTQRARHYLHTEWIVLQEAPLVRKFSLFQNPPLAPERTVYNQRQWYLPARRGESWDTSGEMSPRKLGRTWIAGSSCFVDGFQCMDGDHLFIQWAIDIYFCCFYILATMNKDSMNICRCLCTNICLHFLQAI